MPNIVADPSLLEDNDRLPKRRGSWRTTLSVLALPCAAFLVVFTLEAWTGGKAPIEKAFASSGLPLYGPFARGVVLEMNWIHDATLAWGVLLIWSLIVIYMPIGRWHWLIHGRLIALWFVVGFWFMLLGGMAIT